MRPFWHTGRLHVKPSGRANHSSVTQSGRGLKAARWTTTLLIREREQSELNRTYFLGPEGLIVHAKGFPCSLSKTRRSECARSLINFAALLARAVLLSASSLSLGRNDLDSDGNLDFRLLVLGVLVAFAYILPDDPGHGRPILSLLQEPGTY